MRIGLVFYGSCNEYFYQLAGGIKRFCNSRNIDVLIFITGAPNWLPDDFGYHDWSLTRFLNEKNIDGVIFATGTICHYVSLSEIQSIVRSFLPLPMVSMNVKVPGIPTILESAEKGFSFLITHLLEDHDAKKILFLTTHSKSNEIRERMDIMKKVMKKHSLVLEKKDILYGDYTFYSAENAITEYMEKYGKDFDAVVCVTDELAYGVISGLRKNGLSVPEDVMVTGFDNTSSTRSSNPTLSSVDQNVPLQGELCAKILCDRILGKKVDLITGVDTFCTRRQSCGCVKKTGGINTYIDEKNNIVKENSVLNFDPTLKFLAVQEQVQKVQYHVNRLQGNLNLDELTLNLRDDFSSLGIKKAAICLFDNPMKQTAKKLGIPPKKARVYFAFNEEEQTLNYNPDAFFDCEKSLLPDYFTDFLSGNNTVMSLYHGEFLYGYLVVRLGDYEAFIYTLLCSVIAKSICSAFEVSRRQAENLSLAKTNSDLSVLSLTDELTGIFNRRGFMKIARKELSAAVAAGKKGLVVYGDIDGLKKINDTYGHDAGDRAILAEVELLKKAFRKADTIGRLGGDEFAILSISLTVPVFEKLKSRMNNLCKEWNRNSNEQFTLSISLGAVEFSEEKSDLSKLLRLADVEQYEEKKKHKESASKK